MIGQIISTRDGDSMISRGAGDYTEAVIPEKRGLCDARSMDRYTRHDTPVRDSQAAGDG